LFWKEFEEDSKATVQDVLCSGTTVLSQGCSQEAVARSLDDCSRARTVFHEYLEQKLRCWKEMPWRLAALNHPNSDVCRQHAREILAFLESSPKQASLHHRVTWKFLEPESRLLAQLKQFAAADAEMQTLPELWQVVMELRFIPTCERLQEGDHAIVKRALGENRRASGPFVSMAIRMPEIEALFVKPEDWKDFLSQWPKIQRPDEAAKRFGLVGHPCYKAACEEKAGSKEKRAVLAVSLYNLDPELQFLNKARLRKKKTADADRVKKSRLNFFNQQNPELRQWSVDNVEHRAAAVHLHARMEAGRLYSAPPGAVALPPLEQKLKSLRAAPALQPESAFALEADGDAWSASDGHPDSEPVLDVAVVDAEATLPSGPITFFRLSSQKGGRRRLVPLPAASGQGLAATDVTVSMHEFLQREGSCYVKVEASKAAGVVSPAAVISLDPQTAKTLPCNLQKWSTCKKLVYMLTGFPVTDAVLQLLEKFVSKGAFPGASIEHHLLVLRSDSEMFMLCQELQLQGFARCVREASDETWWVLTDRALANLVHMHEICRPSLVFPPVENLLELVAGNSSAVKQFTSWEMFKVLEHKGFQLCKLPQAKAARRALPPLTFQSERPKWYVRDKTLQTTAMQLYMQALVVSDTLFAGHVSWTYLIWCVSCIHHGQNMHYYAELLDAESMATGDLPEAVEDGQDSQKLQLKGAQDEDALLCMDDAFAESEPRQASPPKPPLPLPLPRHRPASKVKDTTMTSSEASSDDDVVDARDPPSPASHGHSEAAGVSDWLLEDDDENAEGQDPTLPAPPVEPLSPAAADAQQPLWSLLGLPAPVPRSPGDHPSDYSPSMPPDEDEHANNGLTEELLQQLGSENFAIPGDSAQFELEPPTAISTAVEAQADTGDASTIPAAVASFTDAGDASAIPVAPDVQPDPGVVPPPPIPED
ncbi:unnamed protein product, partial [Symbiodinium necroappetens]